MILMKFIGWIIQTLIAAVLAVALIWWRNTFQEAMQEASPENTKSDLWVDGITERNIQPNTIQTIQDFEASLVTMIQQVSPSVVSIVATQNSKTWVLGRSQSRVGSIELWWGSGFLVSREWYIITNRHVVDDTRAKYSVVYEDWTSVEIQDIWLDPSLDIAVLKVATKNVPIWIKVLRSTALDKQTQIWQFAFGVGSTLAETQNSVSFGVISGRNRAIDIGLSNRYAWLYQTNTTIRPWNSGGPLFNTDGEVVGVNTAASLLWESMWFAIPITQEFIDITIDSIEQFNEIKRPLIGIKYIDLDIEIADELGVLNTQWVYIQELVSGSSAVDSGLQVWDIIFSLDDVKISDANPLQYLLFTKSLYDTVVLWVLRGTEELEVALNLWGL
jgi:S1-C subfamily serine protease